MDALMAAEYYVRGGGKKVVDSQDSQLAAGGKERGVHRVLGKEVSDRSEGHEHRGITYCDESSTNHIHSGLFILRNRELCLRDAPLPISCSYVKTDTVQSLKWQLNITSLCSEANIAVTFFSINCKAKSHGVGSRRSAVAQHE